MRATRPSLVLSLLASISTVTTATSPAFVLPSSSLHSKTCTNQRSTPLYEQNKETNVEIPSFITNKVLQQVYPAMLQHQSLYGNVNIPLGTSEGKKCKTLRRLYAENKLSEEEVELLSGLDFRWSSLEDIYEEADFDELLGRLIEYEKEHKNNYQVPKKYPLDPELGAWVTMIRRIGPDQITPQSRRTRLDAVNFAWKSTRSCGSSFMSHFRQVKDKTELSEEDKKWVNSIRVVYEKGNLSDARVKYMDQLKIDWRTPVE
mmetsp:Transcript_17896/g.23695  ORF Transcript_17896/g.23695 Transcript_17896/m.23695 type:complete len:260 (+) Transcript_17896:57-836(+)